MRSLRIVDYLTAKIMRWMNKWFSVAVIGHRERGLALAIDSV
jgi:hypothetical protein